MATKNEKDRSGRDDFSHSKKSASRIFGAIGLNQSRFKAQLKIVPVLDHVSDFSVRFDPGLRALIVSGQDQKKG